MSAETTTRCGDPGTVLSLANTGRGLTAEVVFAELGMSAHDTEKVILNTLTHVTNNWNRESHKGFFASEPTGEIYALLDNAIFIAGAQFAANYYGGDIKALADDIQGDARNNGGRLNIEIEFRWI